MDRIRFANQILRCSATTFSTAIALAGCATFVHTTQNQIRANGRRVVLNRIVDESPRVLACVTSRNPRCPVHWTSRNLSTQRYMLDTVFTSARNKHHKLTERTILLRKFLKAHPLSTSMSPQARESTGAKSHTTAKTLKAYGEAQAKDALQCDSADALTKLYSMGVGVPGRRDSRGERLSISIGNLRTLSHHVEEATRANGWKPYGDWLIIQYHILATEIKDKREELAKINELLKSMKVPNSKDPRDASEQHLRMRASQLTSQIKQTRKTAEVVDVTAYQALLMNAYLRAYFRNGKFISLDLDPADLQTSIANSLEKQLKISKKLAEATAKKILPKVIGKQPSSDGKYHLIGKIDDGGFITRGGAKYQFPAVAVNLDITSNQPLKASKVDFSQVGADVIRIFIEAFGDGMAAVPADALSTACQLTEEGVRAPKLSPIQCYKAGMDNVSKDDFASINSDASKAETVVGTAVGESVRGISWLSLNNDALAKIFATSAGVIARKTTEKVMWCVYACQPEGAPIIGKSMQESFSGLAVKPVKISIVR